MFFPKSRDFKPAGQIASFPGVIMTHFSGDRVINLTHFPIAQLASLHDQCHLPFCGHG